jgi:hypothetical protein
MDDPHRRQRPAGDTHPTDPYAPRMLEYAQQMAAHESIRTTKLYDRRNDQVTLDQVERIVR